MKLILFDLDDTLFDFTRTWNVVLKMMFAEHAATKKYETEAFFAAFQKKSDELYYLYEQRSCSIEAYRNRRLIETLADYQYRMTDEEATAFNLDFVNRYVISLQPEPEVLEMLQRLEEKYLLGIITNGPHDMQEGKIERLGLEGLFPAKQVWISNVVGIAKPDPRIYQLALDYFNVKAEEALFVGDSWEADVAGPIRVGMKAIWLNKYGKPPKDDVEPLATVTRLHELIDHLL
ncbi:HAD family hydrolase [Paenibacillus sp. SYP-B3998]|uniref:HAD family hydrolase n=1 Tax=Paenibacillus sp. SYP-B3998 TaxID=2678564 RepID=A0A6G4A007_9BACL|nr:HAD family hydrolase [Paenibacillus sp. SYP-B3998]NEW07793.1 HAD family hydrolase [Paenibacillus sp. SYP-B3998]